MTRKDALQAIKAKMDYYESDKRLRRAIETLIPELAESEDERIREELIEYHKQQFENNRDQEVGLFHKDAIAWLEKQKESLRDFIDDFPYSDEQKEPKPEWSEEDEKIMDSIINELGQHYKSCTSRDCPSASFSFKAYQKEIDWLKSLRPSWKPSEEQMNKLKEVIYGLCTCGNGPVLKSLYEDLKKLM